MEVIHNEDFKGLKVKKYFFIDEIVYVLSGPILKIPTRTSIEIGFNQHIEDINGQYINHSFDPNIKIDGKNVIAIKNISKNDEITFNYNENETKMACPFKDNSTGYIVSGKKTE